jgi:hypothetical protein
LFCKKVLRKASVDHIGSGRRRRPEDHESSDEEREQARGGDGRGTDMRWRTRTFSSLMTENASSCARPVWCPARSTPW